MKKAFYCALSAAIGVILAMEIIGCAGGNHGGDVGRRAAEPSGRESVDMSGLWTMAVKTPHGAGTPSFDLIQEGDQLSGSYNGLFGKFPVTGSVAGNKFVIQYESNGVMAKYIGKADGDTAKGKVVFGSYGEGTFTGEKQ